MVVLKAGLVNRVQAYIAPKISEGQAPRPGEGNRRGCAAGGISS